jgi:oxygen-independent coproporphyrinogen-3 oxidase
VFSRELKVIGQDAPNLAIADWPTKRAWVQYAFDEMMKAGYERSSAYTLVKNKEETSFVYRDALWHGADMFGTGVASFGHVRGVHVQNVDQWDDWLRMLDRDELPLGRALPITPRQALTREMILQLKTGRLDAGYFRDKFDAEITETFGDAFARLQAEGWLVVGDGGVKLTGRGYLQVDRLLPAFFEPQHVTARYT